MRLAVATAVPVVGLTVMALAVQRPHAEPPADPEPVTASSTTPDSAVEAPDAATAQAAAPRDTRLAVARQSRPSPRVVTLVVRGALIDVETYTNTVEGFLIVSGFDVDTVRVQPDLATSITNGLRITVQTVEVETVTESETIPHDHVEEKTSRRLQGERVVIDHGRDGEIVRTVERVLVDGEVESETVLDEVVTEPVAGVTEVGTAAPPPPPPPASTTTDDSVWDRLAQCEANGNWAAVSALRSGTRYYGGLQFHPQTWLSHGGGAYADYANNATREQQIVVGERVLASQGWRAWPACSSKLGLR